MEAIAVAERGGAIARRELEPPARREHVREPGDERRAIARVRRHRALPRLRADDVGRAREHERRRDVLLPRREQPAGVVEVEMRQHDDIDVVRLDPDLGERVEQHVRRLDHPVALAQRRLEERADAGLEEDMSPFVANQ